MPVFPRMRRYAFDLKSVPLTEDGLKSYDLVLIATNHDAFDYPLIRRSAQLVVDTRGVYQDAEPKIVRA